jgi:hypothetical protein
LYARGTEQPWETTTGKRVAFFTPALITGPRFRPVAVEVTADGVEGFWEGRSIGKFSAALWRERTRGYLARCRLADPDGPYAQGYDPDFLPTGGLGLYVSDSSASFHSVVVEPLPGGD